MPDYLDVVKDPVDLSLVESRLKKSYYATKDIFFADLKRMCDNCRQYNGVGSVYFKAADMLEAYINGKKRAMDFVPRARGPGSVATRAAVAAAAAAK